MSSNAVNILYCQCIWYNWVVGYDVSNGFEILNDLSGSQHRMSCRRMHFSSIGWLVTWFWDFEWFEQFATQNDLQDDAFQYYWVVGYDVSTGFEILNDFSCSKHRMSCRIVHFSAIGWLVTVLALVKLRFWLMNDWSEPGRDSTARNFVRMYCGMIYFSAFEWFVWSLVAGFEILSILWLTLYCGAWHTGHHTQSHGDLTASPSLSGTPSLLTHPNAQLIHAAVCHSIMCMACRR